MRKTAPFGPQIDLTLSGQTLDCCPQTERRRGPSVVWREGKEAPMTRQWLAHLLNLGHNHQTWGSSCKDLPYSDCFGWDSRYCSREGNCSRRTWRGPCLCRCPPDKTIATLLVLVKVHHFLLRLDFLRGQIGPFPLLINKEGRALYNCHSRCAFVIALFVSWFYDKLLFQMIKKVWNARKVWTHRVLKWQGFFL